MDPNNLTLKEASLLLVENFLKSRHKPKSLAPELLKTVRGGPNLLTPARDFMYDQGICKKDKTTYRNAYALDALLLEIETKAKTQNLTEADCHFVISDSLKKEIELEYGVYLAEIEGEASYYL